MSDMAGDKGICFMFASRMPMNNRIKWIAGLIGVGVILQLFVSIFLGWLFVLAGCLLGVIQGKSVQPEVSGAGEWQTTTIEELQDIEKLSMQIGKWQERTDAFKAVSGTGCAVVVLALCVVLLGAVIIAAFVDRGVDIFDSSGGLFSPPIRGGAVSVLWVIDALTMLIPIWFAGSMSAWKPPLLEEKAGYLLYIYCRFKSEPDLEFLPSLNVAKAGDRVVPTDCRLLAKIKTAPSEFIGIQVQISMNDVQGKKYPYSYSVILAKKEFKLAQRVSNFLTPPDDGGWLGLGKLLKSANDRREMAFSQYDGSITELEAESDVDVIVVRQVTSDEGYHTSEEQAVEVFDDALKLARLILKQ